MRARGPIPLDFEVRPLSTKPSPRQHQGDYWQPVYDAVDNLPADQALFFRFPREEGEDLPTYKQLQNYGERVTAQLNKRARRLQQPVSYHRQCDVPGAGVWVTKNPIKREDPAVTAPRIEAAGCFSPPAEPGPYEKIAERIFVPSVFEEEPPRGGVTTIVSVEPDAPETIIPLEADTSYKGHHGQRRHVDAPAGCACPEWWRIGIAWKDVTPATAALRGPHHYQGASAPLDCPLYQVTLERKDEACSCDAERRRVRVDFKEEEPGVWHQGDCDRHRHRFRLPPAGSDNGQNAADRSIEGRCTGCDYSRTMSKDVVVKGPGAGKPADETEPSPSFVASRKSTNKCGDCGRGFNSLWHKTQCKGQAA